MNERKVDHRINLAQKVISGNKLIERHHLERCLIRAGGLQHETSESKNPNKKQGFVSSLRAALTALFFALRP